MRMKYWIGVGYTMHVPREILEKNVEGYFNRFEINHAIKWYFSYLYKYIY